MTAVTVRSDEAGRDLRPLLGEPLPLDLLNTRWIDGGVTQDLLETVAGTAIWLHSADVDVAFKPSTVGVADQRRLRTTRDAVQAVADGPGDQGARDRLNAVLAHGHRTLLLGRDGPTADVVVDGPDWLVPWLTAEMFLDLLGRVPDRIRQCQHPRCVLWFLDTSRSATRRWCSMDTCGNRTKASRHHQSRGGSA